TAVGAMDKLPPGGGLRASLGGDESAIVVNVDGAVRAFRAVCTHEGCPLGWNAQQHLIRCPCHGGAYDTNGHVRSAAGAAHRVTHRGRSRADLHRPLGHCHSARLGTSGFTTTLADGAS